MAPLATPSPHRFLPGARRQQSPNSSTKPLSRLKQSTTVHQDPPPAPLINSPHRPLRPHLPPSASQFAPTPRFSLAKPKPTAQQTNVSTSPPRSSLAHALRPPRVGEDVEDAASSDVEHNEYDEQDEQQEDDTEMLLTAEQNEVIRPSIELQEEQDERRTSLPFSPKRRRLDSNLPSPQKTTHPRFALSSHTPAASASASTSTSTAAPTALRPAFLRPPTPPLTNPLPQAFSPHRKGAAFIPGGTASTVQGWIVAAGQSAVASRKQQVTHSYLQTQTVQSGGWGFRVRVEKAEAMGKGGWRIVGRRDDGGGESLRCLLVGEGRGEVRIGGVIGVRGLGWEVDLDGEEGWWVGIEWEGR